MLVGEDSGRHEYGHLLVVADRLEGCPDGHLGLAEPDIATDQAVHRSLALHVGLYLGCRLLLVGRILIDEAGFQLMLQETVGAVGKALLLSPFGIEQDQVAGDVLDLRLRALLHLFPGAGAQLAQLGWLARVFALVFGELMKRVDADEDNIVVLVDQLDGLLCLAVYLRANQSPELADAVIDVHNVVARGELVQFLERKADLSATSLVALEAVLVETVEDLVIGEKRHVEIVVDEALVNGPVDGGEGQALVPVLKDHPDTVGLFLLVGQYV